MAVSPPPAPPQLPPVPRLPGRPDQPPRDPPTRPPYVLGAAVAAIVLALIVLAAMGTRTLGHFADKSAPSATLARHAGVGAAIATAVAVGSVLAVSARRAGERRRLFATALPWIVAIIALGAVLGTATVPLRDKDSSAKAGAGRSIVPPLDRLPSRGPLAKGTGAQPIDPSLDTAGRPINKQLPVFDASLSTAAPGGVPAISIDSDASGSLDTPLARCPASASSTAPAPPSAPPRPGSVALVPVDFECDGQVDAYARIRLDQLAALPKPGATKLTPNDPRIDSRGQTVRSDLPVYDADLTPGATPGGSGVAVDRDGDGRLDSPLARCSANGAGAVPSPTPVPATTRPTSQTASGGYVLVPIDFDCNGTLDAYGRVRTSSLDELTPPTTASKAGTKPGSTGPGTAGGASGKGDVAGGGSIPNALDDASKPGNDSRDWPRWLVIALISIGGAILALAAFALGRALVRRSGESPNPPEEPADSVAPVAAFDSAIASAAHTQLDHRSAIIAAYAQLLDGLSHAGYPRHPAEGPEEYLRRCLKGLRISPEPVQRLTELFGVARFSAHPLTAADLDAAVRALEQARTELAPTLADVPA